MPTKGTSSKSKTVSKTKTKAKGSTKIDLYAKHKNEYVAGRMPAMVRVGPAKYLGIVGRSLPGADEFTRAVSAMYNVAFTVKMASKSVGKDYVVTKLEGLWWDDGTAGSSEPVGSRVWNWQLLLRVPPFVTVKELREAIDSLVRRGKDDLVRQVQLAELTEGECVQILHIGPYTQEAESIGKMRDFAAKAGRTLKGKHHEIYLSDPRPVPPESLRTILRQLVG